jgi:hypothetical protein
MCCMGSKRWHVSRQRLVLCKSGKRKILVSLESTVEGSLWDREASTWLQHGNTTTFELMWGIGGMLLGQRQEHSFNGIFKNQEVPALMFHMSTFFSITPTHAASHVAGPCQYVACRVPRGLYTWLFGSFTYMMWRGSCRLSNKSNQKFDYFHQVGEEMGFRARFWMAYLKIKRYAWWCCTYHTFFSIASTHATRRRVLMSSQTHRCVVHTRCRALRVCCSSDSSWTFSDFLWALLCDWSGTSKGHAIFEIFQYYHLRESTNVVIK